MRRNLRIWSHLLEKSLMKNFETSIKLEEMLWIYIFSLRSFIVTASSKFTLVKTWFHVLMLLFKYFEMPTCSSLRKEASVWIDRHGSALQLVL